MQAPDPVDSWLREGLAPTEDQLRRIVHHALRPEAGAAPEPALGWRLPAAAAALALLAWGFLTLSLHGDRRETGRPIAGQGTSALITNASGEVELVLPAGPAPRAERRAASHAPGVVEVFNHDGCMAVVLPEGKVRYWIIGGDT